MKIETVLVAGLPQWGILVDDMLDCEIQLSNNEKTAAKLGMKKYKQKVVTSDDPAHYSNN